MLPSHGMLGIIDLMGEALDQVACLAVAHFTRTEGMEAKGALHAQVLLNPAGKVVVVDRVHHMD
jgi:hypothetical protein